jgi:DeoR/GlpR family transcriptional regulator of sugar metabolism
LEAADEPIIVTDSSKFGVRHSIQILSWSGRATLLTDRPSAPNAELNRILEMPRTLKLLFAGSFCERT